MSGKAWAKGVNFRTEKYGKSEAVCWSPAEGVVEVSQRGPYGIWNEADVFHFLHGGAVEGDFEAVVKIAKANWAVNWSKFGLMARGALTPGAVHYSVLLQSGLDDSPAESKVHRPVAPQRSEADRESEFFFNFDEFQVEGYPVWLKLQRRGNWLTALFSEDGESWTEYAAEDRYEVPERLYVGLARASTDGEKRTEVRYEGFEVKRKK